MSNNLNTPTDSSGVKTNPKSNSVQKTNTNPKSPKTPKSGGESNPFGKQSASQTSQIADTKQKNNEDEDSPTNALKLPKHDLDLLKLKGYTIGKAINSGSFSVVCKADLKGKAIAVKIINLMKTSKDYKDKFLPRELYGLKKLEHPNIIKVYDIFTLRKTQIYVFMELADGGDILDLIKEGALPEPKAKPLYKGVADALQYIHKMGFAHRDIKCENMLLYNKRTVAKIGDFGFSRTCFHHSTGERLLSNTYCGSAAYAAPEILKVKPYNAMISDVWSMGVVLYVMVNCRLPFSDKNLKEMLKLELRRQIEFKPTLSELCKDLIVHQLEPDVTERFTMKDVLSHKWFE